MTTVPGDKVPRAWERPLTKNERFWLETIRLASWDSDPAPTLEKAQKLRRIFQACSDSQPLSGPSSAQPFPHGQQTHN